MRIFKSSALQIAAIVLALAVFGVVGAKFAGSRAEQATLARMETVWPDFAAMPEPERMFLIQLSLNCQVVRRPAERAEVVECLRSGARQAGADAPARLERLLPPG
ncbi:hypothetical protein [Massilia sp. AB1]|uniref:hypothetical protein n=1 Tax=Massilia sp. AB1 TaxID=2823371 RepID=UPI001B811F7A|nr:hypothetical protein [Massilia sp. AB1]MBQ5940130.1 hypothetical protein [Massilia sp. AB1]